MKKNMMRRLLAGCLAALLLFSDASSVLASNLSEPIVGETGIAETLDNTESIESSETTESTEVVNDTETSTNTEQVESTEEGASTEMTEIVEESETEESTEEGSELQGEENTEVEPETETESETELIGEPQQVPDIVASSYTGSIYKAYFGLPAVLAPKAPADTNSAWSGDKITNFGYLDGQTQDTQSTTDTWKILDPSTGLIWANGIFVRSSNSDMDTVNATLTNYLNKVADNNADVAKYDSIEKAAINEMRLLTKAEMMSEAYGFNNTEEADATRVIGNGGYTYSYLVNNEGTPTWVDDDGTIGSYSNSNYCGYAPAVNLNTDKVFMTIYSNFYEYGGYAKTDISSTTTSRSWNLLLHSGDMGFNATLPTTAPYDGYYYVDVTGLGSLSYDKVSMVLVDSEGYIAAYINSSYNEDTYDDTTYLSAPTQGSFRFILPTDLMPGTYTVKVFCENEDGSYATGYVSNVVEGTVEVVSAKAVELEVIQSYGEINVYWELENTSGSYTYCNIYRSTSENGTYDLVAENVSCRNSSSYHYWTDTDVRESESSAANGTYYYKIVTLTDSAEYGGTEMISSEVTTNEGVYYGSQEAGDYVGAYVINASGEKVNSLTLHEGEAVKLAIMLVKKDGTTELLDTNEYGGVNWFLYDSYYTTEEYLNKEKVSSDKIGIYPYEIKKEADAVSLPEYNVYIQAEADGTGTYYLMTKIFYWTEDDSGSWYWQMPIAVVEAEEGADYGKRPDIDIATTQEEAEQKLRDFMMARDNTSRVLVESGVVIDTDSIFDIYAERENMKPEEGDYLYYHVGYTDQLSFFWSAYDSSSVSFNGEYYSAYWSTTPFITTAVQEAQVDAYINNLVHTEGGALYNYAHGNATTEQKIKAIYDWIIANVNPNVAGDRRTPIYHTVWHTLFGAYGGYPGSGTCGAFAVLFTRLSREMDIPSKVIMGTDSAAHAYNIVEVGSKWYFIDANSRRYLADEDNFTRAQEQDRYLDSRFIASYLSKIPGNDYYVESTGTAVVIGTDGTTSEAYDDLSKAVAYTVEQAAKEGNETVEYTLAISDGDMAFPETTMYFTGGEDEYGRPIWYDDRVTIDLGGNSLIIRDALSAGLAAKKVHNGVISVGDDSLLCLMNGADTTDSVYENLRVVYKSTQGVVSNTPGLRITGGLNNKVILKNSVSLGEFYIAELYRNVEIDSDLSVKGYIQMQDGTTETDDKITINSTLTVNGNCQVYAGTYEIEELVSKKETTFSAPAETKLIIGSKLTLAGYTVWAGDVGDWGEAGTIEVDLKRQFATAEDTVPYKQATVNWAGSIFNYGVDYVTAPMFHFTAQDYVDGVLQENKALPSGTTIGTVTAKGLNKSTWQYNVALNSTNLSQYLTVETAVDGKAIADIENNVLSVVSLSVTVKGPNNTSQSFGSLKKAVDGLGSVANGAVGLYSFQFAENAMLSGDVVLPSYVQKVGFTVTDNVDVSLDFNGKTITTYASIVLDYRLKLINSAEAEGKLVTTYAATDEAIIFSGVLSGDDIAEYTVIDGVSISATGGTVKFGHMATVGKQVVNATVTARELEISGGDWNVEQIIVNNLEVSNIFETGTTEPYDVVSTLTVGTVRVTSGALTVRNNATLEAGAVSIVSGTLNNYGVLACNSVIENSGSRTHLYAGSKTVVKETADFYYVQLAEDGEPENPKLYKAPEAKVSFNGTFTTATDGLKLEYAVLSETDSEDGVLYDTVTDVLAQQLLFLTNISTFPVALVEVKQVSATPKYTMLLQKGSNVVAASDWIIVKACGADGVETELKCFTTWREALAYMNTLSNTSMNYIVEITEDVDLEEALTMPSRTGGITFRGVSDEEDRRIELTYTGDLYLTVDTRFENISLSAQTYNWYTQSYETYKSTINLAGKNLFMENADAEFGTVIGTTASTFSVKGTEEKNSRVTVDRSVYNIGLLEAEKAEINIGASLHITEWAVSGVVNAVLTDTEIEVENGMLALSGTLTMDNAILASNGRINLVNVVTNGDTNRIECGDNIYYGMLSITGTVGSDNAEEATYAPIRKNAIDITVRRLEETSYNQGDLLVNARKVAPAWFVVGSTYDGETGERTGISGQTYKNGDNIYYGVNSDVAIELRVWDDALEEKVIYGNFANITEAFTEIDRVADVTADYYVKLMSDTDSEVIPYVITTPYYAEKVVVYSDEEAPKTLYFGQQITLNVPLALENIVLAPTSVSSTIALTNNKLSLKGMTIEEGKKLGYITGYGVTGTSTLELVDYEDEFVISGDLTQVGNLRLDNSKLTVEGMTYVGNVQSTVNPESGYHPTLTGTATVYRGNGTVTAVTPRVTIYGNAHGVLEVALRESVVENNRVTYKALEFNSEEMKQLLESKGIMLISASKAPSMVFKLSEMNCGENTDAYMLTKASGYVTAQKAENVGIRLRYDESNGGFAESYFRTFADAVTEINTLAVKRDYTIKLLDACSSTSLKTPTVLSMPYGGYVNTLTIEGAGNGEYVELYHTGDIVLTAPTTLKGVYFEKLVWNGTGYIPVEEQEIENSRLYPSAVSFNTNGNALTIDGKVYFNTPVALSGGGIGTLEVTENGQLATITNGKEVPADPKEQLICGSVNYFSEVVVKEGQIFNVCEYGYVWGASVLYTGGCINVTTLTNAGEVSVIGANAAGTVYVTNANLDGGHLYSSGSINITNMTLEGESQVRAEKEFYITSQLVSATDKATLYSRQMAESYPVPYLNIYATVTLEKPSDKINVGVYPAITAENPERLVKLEGAPQAGAQLLTAIYATAEMFVPLETNVGGVGEYSVDNGSGYVLKKTGNSVCVYYGEEIGVALCKGNVDTGNISDAEVLAYYPTFNDAVNAIDALLDMSAEYTIVLLQDVNAKTNGSITTPVPAVVTLPMQAKKVIITSLSDDVQEMYFAGNLTLRTNTEFARVSFSPVNGYGQGTRFDIATGNYDLTLQDIEFGEASNMELGNIWGSAYQETSMSSNNLMVSGGIYYTKKLKVEEPIIVKGDIYATTVELENGAEEKKNSVEVSGVLSTDNLVLQGYTLVDAKNTIVVKDIYNNITENIGENQTNIINYSKNMYDVPMLTLRGKIEGTNAEPIILNLNECKYEKEELVLSMDASQVRYVLTDKNKLAAVEKAALSDIEFRVDGIECTSEEVVKANQGVYLIEPLSKAGINGAILEISKNGKVTSTRCLDYAQAINEINNLADMSADYTIKLGVQSANVTDTNLVDYYMISSITMPWTNVAASVTIEADEKVELLYSGYISYAGDLAIRNITLAPNADTMFILSKDMSSSTLYMENVTTVADANWENGNSETIGFISNIYGEWNTTDVVLKNCDLRVKSAISNVNNLVVDTTDLITVSDVTVNNVRIVGNSHWDAMGRTTISNLDVSQITEGYYIGSKQTLYSLLPMFTINEKVILNPDNKPSVWKVIKAEARTNDIFYVNDYKDVSFVLAPKENADKFVAWAFCEENISTNLEGITKENLVAYKTAQNEVMNGNADDMVVRIIQAKDGSSNETATYARSFAEAVTVINNFADATADYRMEILKGSIEEPIRTGARSGNQIYYGAMTLPTYAKSITIAGVNEDAKVAIFYTGALTLNCDTRFENILLSEGTPSGNTFFPNYSITPYVYGAYKLEFTGTVQTKAEQDANIVFSSVYMPYGKLCLDGASASTVSSLYVDTLELAAGSGMTTQNVATIANLFVDGVQNENAPESKLCAQNAMYITNIMGDNESAYKGTLILENCFSPIYYVGQVPTTQLFVYGAISDANIKLLPRIYDLETKTYHSITEEELRALCVVDGNALYTKRIAYMPKAMTDAISVVFLDDNNLCQNISGACLYKQDGALFMTEDEPIVKVIGRDSTGKDVYEAMFMSWDQAVYEINMRADLAVSYEMILQDNLGGKAGEENPIANWVMPSYAKEIVISSEADNTYHVIFTGRYIALGCNTTFKNIGIYAVTGVMKNGVLEYEPVTYNISAGNYVFNMENMSVKMNDSDTYISQIETISGGGYGSYTFVPGAADDALKSPANMIVGFGTVNLFNTERDEVVVENQITTRCSVRNGITSVGALNVYPGVTLEIKNGTVAVNNMNVIGATVEAKDINVWLNTELESAKLNAGSAAYYDGRISLNTVTVGDTNNYLLAEQDLNGNTQITISGKVDCTEYYQGEVGESAISVGLCYNNYESYAKVYDGMSLLTAYKAASSWFEPCYTMENVDEDIYVAGMGYATEGYGVYKSGWSICYGNLDEMEAELTIMRTTEETSLPVAYSLFPTYEEAVQEINNLVLYKNGNNKFENYQIALLSDVIELGNVNGNGAYTSLCLPVYTDTVTIKGKDSGSEIRFAGHIILQSNVVFENVRLTPLQGYGNNVIATKAEIIVNNYALVFDNVTMSDRMGMSLIGNIIGASLGKFKMMGSSVADTAYSLQANSVYGLKEVNLVDNAVLDVVGDMNVYQLRFTAEEANASAQIYVDGTFTTSSICKEGTGEVILGKGVGKAMTINEGVSYSHPQEENAGKIKIQVSGSDTKIGTKVLTSRYLNAKDYSCVNAQGRTYGTYQSGTSLMLGKKAV